MILLGYNITVPLVFNVVLHTLGVWVLYKNRADLLYDDEDGNPNTPNTLSLGRCWSWLLFYLAFSFWLRYLTGELPPSTPFPPGLQEMLYACLLYEFAKKGMDISKIWVRGKSSSGYDYGGYGSGGYGSNYRSDYNQSCRNSDPVSRTTNGSVTPSRDQDSGYVPAKAYDEDDSVK